VKRRLSAREVLIGVEGLALLRRMFDGDDEDADARLAEVRRFMDPDADAAPGARIDVPEHAVTAGYARWAATYDAPGNPLVAVEQPAVWSLLATSAAGVALDAACGTGRHTRRLADLGHRVIGVDATPEMLGRAREAVPEATLVRGDLNRLPLRTASVDLAVCALALDHAPTLLDPIREVGRVVRPGGRLVISDIHPVLSALGAAAFFRAADGSAGFVRNHRHVHGEYLDAFAQAGLDVRRCLEPRIGPDEVGFQPIVARRVPEAAGAAYLGLPGALVWDLVRM
jgi:ubiquinone/menaquinone biosynthesis C-methylase UbiE